MIKKLNWVSRHPMTNGQIKTIESLGFDTVERKEVIFGDNPDLDLIQAGVPTGSKVAVVAPSYVVFKLLLSGYKVIEFINYPSARKRGVFLCKGAYTTEMLPDREQEGRISFFPVQSFVSCPLSTEEQEEGNLNY